MIPRPAPFGPQWVVISAPAHISSDLLERMCERARMLVPEERLAVVSVGEGPPRVSPGPPLRLEVCGDAIGLLLAAAHVLVRDPDATLLVLAPDLAGDDEDQVLRSLVASSLRARGFPDDLVLLGHQCSGEHSHPVERQWLELEGEEGEEAPRRLLRTLRPAGGRTLAGSLVETGCFHVWGPTLWSLARRFLPELVDRCDELRLVLRGLRGTPAAQTEERRVMSRIREAAGARSGFLATILSEAPETARVLVLDGAAATA